MTDRLIVLAAIAAWILVMLALGAAGSWHRRRLHEARRYGRFEALAWRGQANTRTSHLRLLNPKEEK